MWENSGNREQGTGGIPALYLYYTGTGTRTMSTEAQALPAVPLYSYLYRIANTGTATGNTYPQYTL